MEPIRLATCSYSEFRPDMGTAIRTTAGGARWFSHQLGGHAKLVTPTRELLAANLPKDAYEFSYRRMLNDTGIEAIRAELARLAAANGDSRLVLLCFDRMNKPENWCHRRMLAAYYLEQTGEAIPELGDNVFEQPWDQGGLF